MKNITLCLYTSTKGHFGRKDIYQKTVNSLLAQFPAERWGRMIASIKYDDASYEQCSCMATWLQDKGFLVISDKGEWKHGDSSHQLGYLGDMARINDCVQTEYLAHFEDDFLIKSLDDSLNDWPEKATAILKNYQNIIQVRVPRYSNEEQRINGLMARHGINGFAYPHDGGEFIWSNDWSNNPYVARTRDLRAALTFISGTNLPRHSEAGLGKAMSLLSWSGRCPYVFFDPLKIRCGHLGTPEGQEDDLSKPLMADV